MTSDNQSFKNWLKSITEQIQFAQRSGGKKRMDGKSGDWAWFERATSYRLKLLLSPVKGALAMLGWKERSAISLNWLREHATELWTTRCLLADDLSRLLYDFSLILRTTSHRHFLYPRMDYDDLARLNKAIPFSMAGLPEDYLGLPLQICDLTLNVSGSEGVNMQVICNSQLLDGINYYRQYFVTREGEDISPKTGEVVLDCGACIGDYSVIFAAMVGPSGQVHAFDPLPLHNRYCDLQSQLNPNLAQVMHFNTEAVGKRTSKAKQNAIGLDRITPGLRVEDSAFDFISLDDYAKNRLNRVDYIKMDIEGAEMDALAGAENIIRTFKPRLAISGYHKPSDLWEIPQKIMSLNPGYKLTFGHHSQVRWESVFYAIHKN
ncbi:MAG: FkbM family methyltransferase [Rudaea sp.]|uniref:FkbM family methyltransferase n=1 Tax=unclassified Rudaea TaxID=2627037 RepID=UPI0010F7A7D8|nr:MULTISPECIES: FkbM family methyltransferase [unclassified Rudaea]MBN8886286.1 FkbM family methyltransferase [Rudaea sp.]MBR0346612.1 FkbM family methyltransferase [Rudaea sp.]